MTAETRKMKGRKLERVIGERRMEKRRDGKMHSRVKKAKYLKTVVLNTGPWYFCLPNFPVWQHGVGILG